MDIVIDTKRQLHPMEDLEDGNFRRSGKRSDAAHTTLSVKLFLPGTKGSCHFHVLVASICFLGDKVFKRMRLMEG